MNFSHMAWHLIPKVSDFLIFKLGMFKLNLEVSALIKQNYYTEISVNEISWFRQEWR